MKMHFLLISVLFLIAQVCVASPLSDDEYTVGLWHLDSIFTTTSRTLSTDDDSSNPSRNNYLVFGNSSSTNTSNARYPSLTTGSGGFDGEALLFDGVDDMCYTAYKKWPGVNTIRVELWFKHTAVSGEKTLIAAEAGSPWELRISGASLYFYTWYKNSDGTSAGYKRVAKSFTSGAWNHVVAIVDEVNTSLEINGSVVSTARPADTILYDSVKYIVVGCKNTGDRHYAGLIDEIKVTTLPYPEFAYMREDAFGTFLLWHMDETFSASSKVFVADDDLENPSRDNDLAMLENATYVTPGTNQGPQLVTSFVHDSGVDFGNALSFNGYADRARIPYAGDRGIDYSNFQFEAWIKVDDSLNTYGNEARYYIVGDYPSFEGYLIDSADSGWLLRWTCWYGSSGWTLSASYPLSGWHHIRLTWYEGTQKIYIDGEELAYHAQSTYPSVKTSTGYLYLGAADASEDTSFFGLIDEVRISQAVPTEPECGYWGYHISDLNKDCYVNLEDLDYIVSNWLRCSLPGDSSCEQF